MDRLESFQPELIEAEARRMDRSATTTLVLFSIFGLILGLFAFALTSRLESTGRVLAGFIPLILMVGIGESRARQIRFQAQTIRLQLQIERNTSLLANILHALVNRPS